ncbi:MAG: S9 family peptidase [Ardenticatenaceae bacterium]|nr:S9 family peptidase [Ardenticatenaceae bacterium]
MAQQVVSPYGSWQSPITSDLIVAETISLGQIALDGETVYWLEGRPSENGRYVIVQWRDGQKQDVTPPGFNVRTRVHEYGGGAFTVHDGTVYFSNFINQQLYRHKPGETPEAVTPVGQWRYADGVIVPPGQMICVREDHSVTGGQDAVNSLVLLQLDGQDSGQILASGNDFYASPRLSPNGRQLAWITWNRPNMPWDGTELWLADLTSDGRLANEQLIAGGLEESIYQPAWSPDGMLHFVSDRTGWWNLYRWQDGQTESLCPMAAEFGLPQWAFGSSRYGFEAAGSLIVSYTLNGRWHLARLNSSSRELTEIPLPYSVIRDRNNIAIGDGYAVLGVGHVDQPATIVRLKLQNGDVAELQRSSQVDIDPGYLSIPQAIEFPTDNDLTAHAFYYPPQNQDFVAPAAERPPLLVISHGGPTGATDTVLDLEIQYWTSRGFAVVDVNYGGSTGYGRAYRQRLNGQWGIVDVHDCINAAKYLVAQGLADERRLAVRGGSAGGYTTLAALAFHDVFSAGASHFGVSDLEGLAQESHKFESRYLDNMVGPYPARRDLYQERSPIHYAHQINCPLILFQGLEDKVVPANQAERMFEAVKLKEIPVAYLAYEGEQHGFRRAENIKRTLDAELYFYSKVFDFPLPEPIEPVAIENMD